MTNRNHLVKLVMILVAYIAIWLLIFGLVVFIASCSSFKQGRTDPCFYSDKCLSDVIEREAKAQKDYYHGRP